jgi:predicted NAD/FAD-binding protein
VAEAKGLDVAVIGGGAAGITAAYLLQREHSVTLYERNDYVGGHTHTVTVPDGPDAGTPVDTGFIVLNDKTYPTLHKLLKELGVAWRWSDMSFGYHCEETGLQYAGTSPLGLFAQPINLLRPRYLGMLLDIRRFCTQARRDLDAGTLGERTLGRYVADGGYGEAFSRDYLVPMGAAIWSTSLAEMLEFPAETFVRFFANHGLLALEDRPRWQTVVGGSQSYVRAFLKGFRGKAFTEAPVAALRREGDGVVVRLKDGREARHDRAVVAAHADEALRLLADPSDEERAVLGAWRYQRNHTVLHTDETVLPPNRRAWASWNYLREKGGGKGGVSMTYHMNRLQGLASSRQYCVTLNRRGPISKNRIIKVIEYEHPAYTVETIRAQGRLLEIQGKRGTYFCGSYFGYGFHEDAVKAGAGVARAFGIEF